MLQHGIYIDDDLKIWRADGIRSSLNEFGDEYTQISGPIDTFLSFISEDAKSLRADGSGSYGVQSPDNKGTDEIPRMNDCDTLDEAIRAMHDNLDKVSPRDLFAFWTVVPKFPNYERVGKLTPQLQAIFNKTADQIGNYGPRDLEQITLAFAKIVKSIKEETEGRNVRWSRYHEFLHNTFIVKGDIIFQFIANTARPMLYQFEPRFLSNLAYAYDIIDYVPKFDDGSTLFHHIAEESIAMMGNFEPRNLVRIVLAFKKVKVSHPELFEKVGDHITSLDYLNKFKPKTFSNILATFARAEVSHPQMFVKVGNHIVNLPHLNNFTPNTLVYIVWAFAKAQVSHPRLMDKVADHIVSLDNLDKFAPHALSNIVYAFAIAGVSHPRLMKKVADHIVSLDNLDGFSAHNILDLVWGFSELDVHNAKLYVKLTDVAVESERRDDFSNQDIENLLRWTE